MPEAGPAWESHANQPTSIASRTRPPLPEKGEEVVDIDETVGHAVDAGDVSGAAVRLVLVCTHVDDDLITIETDVDRFLDTQVVGGDVDYVGEGCAANY